MNESKRIDNSRIKIVKQVGAKVHDEKKALKHYKNKTMGVIFNTQNSQLLTWSVPTEEIFQVHGHNRPVANLPVVDFVLSREKCHYQSHLIRNFRFFSPYFGFLLSLRKYERHCL